MYFWNMQCPGHVTVQFNLHYSAFYYPFISRIFDSSYVLGCGRDFKFAV